MLASIPLELIPAPSRLPAHAPRGRPTEHGCDPESRGHERGREDGGTADGENARRPGSQQHVKRREVPAPRDVVDARLSPGDPADGVRHAADRLSEQSGYAGEQAGGVIAIELVEADARKIDEPD